MHVWGMIAYIGTNLFDVFLFLSEKGVEILLIVTTNSKNTYFHKYSYAVHTYLYTYRNVTETATRMLWY